VLDYELTVSVVATMTSLLRVLKPQVFEYSFCDKILYPVGGFVFHFLAAAARRPVLYSRYGQKSREE
jgi:hypothetical protein